MQKVLGLFTLGIFIWGITLAWPELNNELTPPLAGALVVGLVAAIGAYMLGQRLKIQPSPMIQPQDKPASSAHAQATHPTSPIIYPFSRTPRPTQPIPTLIAPDLHTRLTRPMPVVIGHAQHSRITRPMPIGLTR